MKDVSQYTKSLNQVLHFNFIVQVLEQCLKVPQRLSPSWQLKDQHNLIESWQSLKVLINEVLHIVFASIFIPTHKAQVCEWVEGIDIKKKPSLDVVDCNQPTIDDKSAISHERLSKVPNHINEIDAVHIIIEVNYINPWHLLERYSAHHKDLIVQAMNKHPVLVPFAVWTVSWPSPPHI